MGRWGQREGPGGGVAVGAGGEAFSKEWKPRDGQAGRVKPLREG